MKWWNRVLLAVFFTISILILHMGFTILAPYPLNTLQVALLLLAYIIIIKRAGTTVWMAFVIGFVFDIFSAIPFGIFILSYTLTTLLLYWLFRDILTQQSFWAVAALTAAGLVVFRLIFTIALAMTQHIILKDLLVWYGWELLFTIGCGVILYFVFGRHKRLYRA